MLITFNQFKSLQANTEVWMRVFWLLYRLVTRSMNKHCSFYYMQCFAGRIILALTWTSFWHLPPYLKSSIDPSHPQHGNIIPLKYFIFSAGQQLALLHFFKDVFKELNNESELFIWSPNTSDTNLVYPDGICGNQYLFTETPPHNLHDPKGLLIIPEYQYQKLQDTLMGQSFFRSKRRAISILSGWS